MKILTGLPVASVLILTACLALCVEGRTWALKGQGLDVVHRDDAGSPYYDPSAEKEEVLVSAIARSRARYESLNRKAIQFPLAEICNGNSRGGGKGPLGGPVSAPPSSGAQEYLVSVKLGTPGKEVCSISTLEARSRGLSALPAWCVTNKFCQSTTPKNQAPM